MPVINPVTDPLINPKPTSLKTYFQSFFISTSPKAMLRMTTDNVWEPAFPPIPVTIGIAAASATTWMMTSSNIPTVKEARKAVIKLMTNQGSLLTTEVLILLPTFSSLLTPDSISKSSVCSSTITSMMSSIVMMPRMTFRRFTTGMTFRSYLETISETSS